MTSRVGLVAMLLIMSLANARAEFGLPYITPYRPEFGETLYFNISQGGCDGIVGADSPEVSREGSYVHVLAQGVRYTNPELCTLAFGIATYPIGVYPVGEYTMQLDLRYPAIGGDFVVETLGVAAFSVREGGPNEAPPQVPALDRVWLAALAALMAAAAAFRFAQRARVR